MTRRGEEAVVEVGRGTGGTVIVIDVAVIDHMKVVGHIRGKEREEVAGGGTVITVASFESPGTRSREREAAATTSREEDAAEMTGKDVNNRDCRLGEVAVKVTYLVPSGHS